MNIDISINQGLCISCGCCEKACIFHCISIKKTGATMVRPDACMKCGHCYSLCPTEAITMSGECKTTAVTDVLEADSLLQFMRQRRSTRNFLPNPVDLSMLETLFLAGAYAPSGVNRQSVSFSVISQQMPELLCLCRQALNDNLDYLSTKLNRDLLMDIATKEDRLFFGAPVVICVCVSGGKVVDGAIAASYMDLLANSMGLGACFNGIFNYLVRCSKPLQQFLQISDSRQLVVSLAVGYPATKHLRIPARQPIEITYL